MLSIDLNQPLIIIGDLNLDLLLDNNKKFVNPSDEQLQQLIHNYNLTNHVYGPTRCATYKCKIN